MKYFLLLVLGLQLPLLAQDSGKKDYPNLGLSFDIPDGWIGQENEIGYLMGSNTHPGLILILPHQTKSLSELEMEARQGMVDEAGTNLTLAGEITGFGKQGLQAFYEGTVQHEAAKAYAIGLINPLGSGISIIGMTTSSLFSDVHQNAVKALANSVRFYQPIVKESKSNWKEMLQNARLTYMHSYSSNTGSYGGYTTGGGFSEKEVIDLCAQGYFNYSSNSSMSIDTGGAFGSSSGSDEGAGTWRVLVNDQGQDYLQLSFHNGKVMEYQLSLQDNKTYLNGYRYFRTYGDTADDGPDCR